MTTTTMRRLVPKELIPPLKLLGKWDWLRWSLHVGGRSYRLSLNIPADCALLDNPDVIAILGGLASNLSPDTFLLYVVSKALAEGPKLLCPTADRCVALEHVGLNVSYDEYEQPFPTFLLRLPPDYRKRLSDRFRVECPDLVIVHHDRTTKCILSFHLGGPDEAETQYFLSPVARTIEETLDSCEGSGDDVDQSDVVLRVALNFGLLMTHFGVRDRGPLDPVSHEKHLRNARRKNREKAGRARALLDAEVNLIEFNQDVIVYDHQDSSRRDADGVGSPKRPHWRRGHFRRQFYGHARSCRKLIFVKPVLIKAHRFQGDPADTEYRLTTAN